MLRILFCLFLLSVGLFGQSKESYVSGDSVRIPYQVSRVYKIKLVKGVPAMLELPFGETVDNIWIDKMWFLAETTGASGRVLVRAQAADNVEGQQTTIHIETNSGLRISAVLECIPFTGDVPPTVYIFYVSGEDEEIARRRLIDSKVKAAVDASSQLIEDRYKVQLERWKVDVFGKINTNYHANGKIIIERVIDDGIQTWIYVRGTGEIPTIQVVDRDKLLSVVNFEFLSGAYVVNRVLSDGEQFALTIGKERTFIRKGK